MRILWDVAITMSDGVALRADIFLPHAPGRYAAIMNYGPYGKGLSWQLAPAFKSAWGRMVAALQPPQIANPMTFVQSIASAFTAAAEPHTTVGLPISLERAIAK